MAFFRSAPIASLDELKGGKWRSASFWHLDFLKNAGATPVTMHWGLEIPEALRAKTLDGLMVNVDSGYMLKVHETAPHVLVSKDLWLGHVYILTMNRQVRDSLAQEDRDAIGRAAKRSYESLGAAMGDRVGVVIGGTIGGIGLATSKVITAPINVIEGRAQPVRPEPAVSLPEEELEQ